VLIRCIRLLLGCESRLKSRERRLRRVGHLEAKSACAKRLVSPLLAANPLNHTPKNFIREVFFFFSWIFFSRRSSLSFCSDLRRSTLERQRGRAPDALDSFYFTFCLRASDHQVEADWGPRAPPNSSCDDIWLVLVSPLE
jgi:hypothetical protein